MNPRFVQAIKFQTSSLGIGSTDTSIILNSFQLPDGTAITTADFGTTGFGVIAPGTEKEESISFTGVTQNADGTATLTGVTRGLGFVHPYTGSSTRAYAHGRSDFVLANSAAFYGNLRDYIDSVAVAGASNADDATKGIVEVATAAEIDADTALGGTGAALSISPDQLDLSKYGTRLPSSDQKAAMTGTSGTPSASNKYVTNADTTGTGSLSRESVTSRKLNITAPASGSLGASTTSITDALTYSVTGGVLGTTNAIRIKIPITEFKLDSGASTFTVRFVYGSTTMNTLSLNELLSGDITSNDFWTGYVEVLLYANASASAQKSIASVALNDKQISNTTSAVGHGAFYTTTGTATESSGSTLDAKITIQYGNSSSDNGVTFGDALIEILR